MLEFTLRFVPWCGMAVPCKASSRCFVLELKPLVPNSVVSVQVLRRRLYPLTCLFLRFVHLAFRAQEPTLHERSTVTFTIVMNIVQAIALEGTEKKPSEMTFMERQQVNPTDALIPSSPKHLRNQALQRESALRQKI
eukprot:2819296-Amphidinium_carterae.1